jgi:hypothetical protein
MVMAKKYFPNNWQEFKDEPDDSFIPHTFQELMEWKVGEWEIPSSIYCILRCMNLKTGKVKEYVYQSQGAAFRKLEVLAKDPELEVTICTNEFIGQTLATHD